MVSEMRLLLIEDQALIAMELESLVEELGHEVLAIGTTLDNALALVGEWAAELDGALLDVDLGGCNSLPVAEALRGSGVPFVICTGYAETDIARLGFDAPSLVKPYRKRELHKALKAFE